MFENYAYSGQNYELDDFGVFHLSVNDAAELVSKILCLEGELDVAVPDKEECYTLRNPELTKLLSKHTDKYRSIIIAGLEKGTLKAAYMSRNPDETIRCDETYLKMAVLTDWLMERNIHITGDWYAEYAEAESRIAEAVLHTIEVERSRQKNGEKQNSNASDIEKISRLERRILFLESEQDQHSKKAVKPLHVKERESLLKMVIGMAIKGYGHNPNASKNTSAKEISDDLIVLGMSVNDDTIRKWLKEAVAFLPPKTE